MPKTKTKTKTKNKQYEHNRQNYHHLDLVDERKKGNVLDDIIESIWRSNSLKKANAIQAMKIKNIFVLQLIPNKIISQWILRRVIVVISMINDA